MKGDYVKRRKILPPPGTSLPAVTPRPPSRVVFYDTKPQKEYVAVKVATTAAAPTPIDTITPILHELLSWQRKVNQRLKRYPPGVAPGAAPPITPPPVTVPVIATGTTPTLYVRMKPSHQGSIYSIPDRILGRNVGLLSHNQTVALYEPWTENDQGIWMRCASGGWVQLWDRTTGTYFAD